MVTAGEPGGARAPRPDPVTVHGIDVARVEAAIAAAEALTSCQLRVSIARFYFWGNPRRAAERVFRHLHMERTRRRNGVLIFVVPRRRRFEILSDVGIGPHVPPAFWEEIAAGLTADLRAGEPTRGLERALAAAASKLGDFFPPDPAGERLNELPDRIVPAG